MLWFDLKAKWYSEYRAHKIRAASNNHLLLSIILSDFLYLSFGLENIRKQWKWPSQYARAHGDLIKCLG